MTPSGYPFAGGSSPFMFPLAIGGLVVVLAFVVSRVRYLGRLIQEQRDQRGPEGTPPNLGRLHAELVFFIVIAVVLLLTTTGLTYVTCFDSV